MSEKLSLCPHCGGSAGFTNLADNWHQVICGACGCRSNEFPGKAEDARPKAAASWNARADGWRPIETAPRQGREMILLLTPSRFPQVAFSNTWWTTGFSVENKPTHWMRIDPLPADPEQGVKA